MEIVKNVCGLGRDIYTDLTDLIKNFVALFIKYFEK